MRLQTPLKVLLTALRKLLKALWTALLKLLKALWTALLKSSSKLSNLLFRRRAAGSKKESGAFHEAPLFLRVRTN
jgi:hypothetical protein